MDGTRPVLEGNLEAIFHLRFPLVKSFLSVTRPQLMVPHATQSTHQLSSALPQAKKFSQLPVLRNHANYGPGSLTWTSSDPDYLPPLHLTLDLLCSACPSIRLRPWWGRPYFPENEGSPKIIITGNLYQKLDVIQITELELNSLPASFLLLFTANFLRCKHYYYSCFTDEGN